MSNVDPESVERGDVVDQSQAPQMRSVLSMLTIRAACFIEDMGGGTVADRRTTR